MPSRPLKMAGITEKSTMMMVELTSVPGAAWPVTELADHLRLARGFADDGSQDAQLESCLRAAVSAIEARIGKALFQRRFGLTLMDWRDASGHPLPVAPVVAVEAVKLISRSGDETLVSPDAYVLRPDGHRPVLAATASNLPAPSQSGTIEIEFTAGFSADWAGMPADLKRAVLMLAGQFWGQDWQPDTAIPATVSVLLEPYRQLRLRGAGA